MLEICHDLIMLSRGRDELLLANGLDLKTLYIKEGRSYVKAFLDAVPQLATPQKILEKYPNDAPLLEILLDHGILVDATVKPPANAKKIALSDQESSTIYKGGSLFLLLSQSCNLGCIYCLNGKNSYKTSKNLNMSEEVACIAVEKRLAALKDGGILEIVLFGGEPLLNWPLAKKVISHCEGLKSRYPDKRWYYFLTTNLTFMPPDLIEWIKCYKIKVLVDIDGPEPIHNKCRPYKTGSPSYADIVTNLNRLAEAEVAVGLRTTVTALNQDYLTEIAQLHKNLGGIGSAFVPVCPVNSDEEMLPEYMLPSPEKILASLFEIKHRRVWANEDIHPFSVLVEELSPAARLVSGCGATHGNTVTVNVNGDTYPCIYLVGNDRFFLGNVLQDNWPDSGKLSELLDILHVDHLEKCWACPWRYYCGGGCPIAHLIIYDNPQASKAIKEYARKSNCEYTRTILEAALWEKAERAATLKEGEKPPFKIRKEAFC